jgi:hypothetical protein
LELVSQLSVSLQNRHINFSPVTGLSKATISSVTHLCSDESFSQLWVEVQALGKEEGCNAPSLPRKCKILGRIGGGLACGELMTPSTCNRTHIYFPVLYILVNDVKQRFQENDLKILHV